MSGVSELSRRNMHRLFQAGVVFKGIGAFVDILGSFIVLFASQQSIVHMVALFTQEELIEDPHAMIAGYLLNTAATFSAGTKTFAFLYLLIHGLVNFVLVIGLWKKKHWAYPVALSIFSVLVIYQLYRFTHTQSLWLIIFSIFDITIIWLINKEYTTKKRRVHKA